VPRACDAEVAWIWTALYTGGSFRMSTCLIARTWQSRLSHQDNEGRINKSLGRLSGQPVGVRKKTEIARQVKLLLDSAHGGETLAHSREARLSLS
jgi:hypothetical protein